MPQSFDVIHRITSAPTRTGGAIAIEDQIEERVDRVTEADERGEEPAHQRAADPDQRRQDQAETLGARKDGLRDDPRQQSETTIHPMIPIFILLRQIQAGWASASAARRAMNAPNATTALPTIPAPSTSFRGSGGRERLPATGARGACHRDAGDDRTSECVSLREHVHVDLDTPGRPPE